MIQCYRFNSRNTAKIAREADSPQASQYRSASAPEIDPRSANQLRSAYLLFVYV